MLASHTLNPNATLPARFIRAPVDAYTPDLVGAVDCVLGTTDRLAHMSCKSVVVSASLTLTDTTLVLCCAKPVRFASSQFITLTRCRAVTNTTPNWVRLRSSVLMDAELASLRHRSQLFTDVL